MQHEVWKFAWGVVAHFGPTLGRPCVVALPSSNDASARVGTMAGSFRVDESGGANYSIPLVVAPGSGGGAPLISLNYSSHGGNGVMGVGWSVGGLSAVVRCQQTLATDGANAPITLGSGDRFCLDGQKLIAVRGSYGANNTEYRTEIESYARITSHTASSINGPAYFKVRRKDGTTWWYGNTTGSRNMANGRGNTTTVLSWHVNEVRDGSTNGNGMRFTYKTGVGPGEMLISEIGYSQGNHAVRFTYESRTNVNSGHVAGSVWERTKRLTSVQTRAGGNALRNYNISYRYGGEHGLSQVTQIRECDGSGRVCHPPTRFDWSDIRNGYQSGAPSTAGNGNPMDEIRAGDVNGDGRADLVYRSDRTLYVITAGAGGLGSPTARVTFGSGADETWWHLFDYNGDGRQDLLYKLYGYWRVRTSTASTPFSTLVASTAVSIPVNATGDDMRLADLNGDGLTDMLYFVDSSPRVRFLNPPPNGAGSRSFGNEQSIAVPDLSSPNNPVSYDWSNSLLLDANGDGNLDYLVNMTRTPRLPPTPPSPPPSPSPEPPRVFRRLFRVDHAALSSLPWWGLYRLGSRRPIRIEFPPHHGC